MTRPRLQSLARRRLLQAAALGALAPLAACAPPISLNATFLQLWLSHLDLTRDEWRRRIATYRRLGCREIFLQWVGLEGGRPDDWMAPRSMLDAIFDEADRSGLGVHVGLPYDQRWWNMLAAPDDAALAAYLDHTRDRGVAYMRAAAWPERRNFRGWYVPYELEQYNWARPERQALLVPWLDAFTRASLASCHRIPSVSTYHSRLGGTGSLMQLWSRVLDEVRIHPMIQDGVGVAGLANYQALEPLHDMLLKRRAAFDLVMELFEELPSGKTDGTTFKARSADFNRVRQQWDVARGYGAKRIVAFTLDPWVIGDTPEARALMDAWMAARV
ncbi:Tat pathway signal protein [Achromobacter xylosoxidans]|nr:DUF4434 domain-containing protein [Achromobacter xylosoxidans]KMJ90464.1 Tat pathway signal protein [Achromobacter xylosoxidans]OFO69786.1 Tat pathway signal protein [Achromobacter xylosoxidans]OMG86016.1 Tat pathway signal protein [Achromobacter xylosoxidans]OMG87489.1 Tat pathway signal protein [Achromobacter xylosoxidans]